MAEQGSNCPQKTRTETIYTESTTKEEKNWICDEVLKEGKSIKEVANNHRIKYDTMQKWVRKLKIGREVRGCRAGRPMALSQQQQELVRQKIGSDGKYSDDVDEIIWKATCDTARERKNDLPKDPISKNTKRKYFEMLGVDKFKVEITSKARKIAVADVANFITLAAVNYEMIKVLDTPEELILNIGATQYQVEEKNRVKPLGLGTCPGCSAWLGFCDTRCCFFQVAIYGRYYRDYSKCTKYI